MNENWVNPLEPDENIDAIIYRWDHPALTEPALEVESFDEELARLAGTMIKTMRQGRGAGLAANQVGVTAKMFVCMGLDSTVPLIVVNPVIIECELPRRKAIEGCLSIPGYSFRVPRYEAVTVRAQNLSGEEFVADAEGFEAQVFQHEIDHLHGMLLIDRLPSTEAKRAYRALRREG